MSLVENLDRESIDAAISESASLGRNAFRDKYGMPMSRSYELIANGVAHDIKPIVAAAHFTQFGTHVAGDAFPDGERALQAALRVRGYKVRRVPFDFSSLTIERVNSTLDRFDELGREAFLAECSVGQSVKFFIERDGKRYDAKPILLSSLRVDPEFSMLHTSDIPGDEETIATPLRKLGFSVVVPEADKINLSEAIERVLKLQLKWKANESPEMQERTRLIREDIRPVLRNHLQTLGEDSTYEVESSVGVGNYAKIPWWRIYEPGHSPRATEGWYIVFLPAADGSSCTLSLNQASSKPTAGQFPPKASTELLGRASRARSLLVASGLLQAMADPSRLVPSIALSDDGLGLAYSRSHVIGFEYLAGEVPPEEQILSDVSSLIPLLEHLMKAMPADPQSIDSTSNSADDELAWIRNSLYWSNEEILELVDALTSDRPQLILSGPPGTGKTFVARHIAAHLVGESSLDSGSDRIEIVQFHPSYGYEEFVEGLQPAPGPAGGFQFINVPGKILQLAQRIIEDRQPRVLIVDEINRANIHRVFGELLFLLEYRDTSINLKMSPAFSLPSNLFIIGTMNTTDRGIRSLDIAMRRRFNFFELPPDVRVLKRFYENGNNNGLGQELFDGFQKLNQVLGEAFDRHHQVGHSFFMRKQMDNIRLRFIWRQQLFPLIEDFYFDRPDLAEEFTVERFWPSV